MLAILFGSQGLAASVKNAQGDNKEKKEGQKKVAKIEAGTQMLLVFPTTPQVVPFSEKELSLFRGSLSETDRLGIIVADRKQQLLPLQLEDKQPIPSAKIIEALALSSNGGEVPISEAASNDAPQPVYLEDVLRSAVAQLSNLEGMLKAVIMVLDGPLMFSAAPKEVAGVTEDSSQSVADESGDADTLTMLSALLALNNVILYTVYPDSVENEALEKLTSQSGGKNLYLSNRVDVNDALYWAYDSILLRTIQLAPQQALYESDEVCPPAVAEAVVPAQVRPSKSGDLALLGVSLQLISLAFGVVIIVIGVFIWKRVGLQQPVSKPKDESDKSKQASSFSKLTIGLNRVRNSFADAESKMHALSADLDDFGSENWELQKKIISAYAEMAGELFLLYDHVTLRKDDDLSDGDKLLKRKIEQLLDEAHVDEICPNSGEKFHSKYHCHAGERYSDHKAGSVVEVVRKGYQRKGFVSEEPFVIRQAEVIVSAGNNQGDKS